MFQGLSKIYRLLLPALCVITSLLYFHPAVKQAASPFSSFSTPDFQFGPETNEGGLRHTSLFLRLPFQGLLPTAESSTGEQYLNNFCFLHSSSLYTQRQLSAAFLLKPPKYQLSRRNVSLYLLDCSLLI